MPNATSVPRQKTDELLAQLSTEEREYLLCRLASEKLADAHSSESIPVRRPGDGTVVGYLRRLVPPGSDEQATMNDRARRTDPAKGRSSRELLERMEAGDVEGVRKFIH
jgi:hypothetical protein